VNIVATLATKLSWTHFIELLPLRSDDAMLYYARETAEHGFSAKELRHQISRKAYENHKVANTATTPAATGPPPSAGVKTDLSAKWPRYSLEPEIELENETVFERGPGEEKYRSRDDPELDAKLMFTHISKIIEARKRRAGKYAYYEVNIAFWEIGRYLNSVLLGNERAEYGKKILSSLAPQLMVKYGKSFAERNLYRMMQFAEKFSDVKILSSLAPQLSWTHFIQLLPLESEDERLYYAKEAAQRNFSVRELSRQIARKAYERQENANSMLMADSKIPFNSYKDPYILDFLGMIDNFSETNLEEAILMELKSYILEFGDGFAFVDSQKRMIIDGEDIVLDLLFFNLKLRRHVAVELKVGEFKAEYMGQMMLYLKWLNRYAREEWQEQPIGIILCTSANRAKVEMLEMDKVGIVVAEYWTGLPPKAEFEQKIRELMEEARERLEHRKNYPKGGSEKNIDYYYESKDDDE